ncbi:hypothetical protein PPO43_15850 [Saprospira sp. CCB-QB6]|uniref:hypothetical protein n=1 Tax=Saprospira sp. CCB-QB6 TaxID=3023936 RepID=UPI00234B44BE|nr:hypothetical protein [Saprospira sp. CCB-QB6]WCL81447.1 hypothetical protein PPO43_15850 [Saprospira sp. CCB-QB6]
MIHLITWDSGYLDYVENKALVTQFLEEKDPSKHLAYAKQLLHEYPNDIFSFGFVAARAITLDSSGRNFNNPLHSLWTEIRKKSIAILNAPPMQCPLEYSFPDYKLASWVLFVTAVPADLKICLQLLQTYGNKDSSLGAEIKGTIYELNKKVWLLDEETQKMHLDFLVKELATYPEDNDRAIKELLLFAEEEHWNNYLLAVKSGKIVNMRLAEELFYGLLYSPIEKRNKKTRELVQNFLKGKQQDEPWSFFLQQLTKSDLEILEEVILAHDEFDQLLFSQDDNQWADFLKEYFFRLQNRLLFKDFYQGKEPHRVKYILDRLGEYIFEESIALNAHIHYMLLLQSLFSKEDEFLQEKMKQAIPAWTENYGEQCFPINAAEILEILER